MAIRHYGMAVLFGLILMNGTAMAAGDVTGLNQLAGSQMDRCLSDLNMLKTVNQSRYDEQSAGLNGVIGGATRYLVMRTNLVGMSRLSWTISGSPV